MSPQTPGSPNEGDYSREKQSDCRIHQKCCRPLRVADADIREHVHYDTGIGVPLGSIVVVESQHVDRGRIGRESEGSTCAGL